MKNLLNNKKNIYIICSIIAVVLFLTAGIMFWSTKHNSSSGQTVDMTGEPTLQEAGFSDLLKDEDIFPEMDSNDPVNGSESKNTETVDDSLTTKDSEDKKENETSDDSEASKTPDTDEYNKDSENIQGSENSHDSENSQDSENSHDSENPQDSENSHDSENTQDTENAQDTQTPGETSKDEDSQTPQKPSTPGKHPYELPFIPVK